MFVFAAAGDSLAGLPSAPHLRAPALSQSSLRYHIVHGYVAVLHGAAGHAGSWQWWRWRWAGRLPGFWSESRSAASTHPPILATCSLDRRLVRLLGLNTQHNVWLRKGSMPDTLSSPAFQCAWLSAFSFAGMVGVCALFSASLHRNECN